MTDKNFDSQELSKFTKAPHLWWDETSIEYGALHAINPLRLAWIEQQAPLKGKAILDVGCGGGILAESMAQTGAVSVLGIDLGEASLTVAKLHALETQTRHLAYQCIAAEDLALEQPESFDIVTCMEMLEHVPDPQSIVAACAMLVKAGGWVFFSSINRNVKAFAQAVVAAEYVLGLVPRGTHRYERLIKPSELITWGRRVGLELHTIKGLSYNPLTKRYSLVDDASVNFMLAMKKI